MRLFLLSFLISFLLFSGHIVNAQFSRAAPDTTGYLPPQITTLPPDSILPATNLKLRFAQLSPVTKGAVYLGTGVGIWTATYLWVDEPVQRFTLNLKSKAGDGVSGAVNPLGRQKYWAPISGAVSLGGVLLKDPKLQKFGMVSMGSLFVSGGITTFTKNKTHRYRPDRSSKNNVYDWNSRESIHTALPSAHATVAFAVATSFADVYGKNNNFVSPMAYSLATLVGVARIYDNAHWVTDFMAGAASGYLSAKGTGYLYDLAEKKLNLRREQLLISPQVGMGSGDLRATLTF